MVEDNIIQLYTQVSVLYMGSAETDSLRQKTCSEYLKMLDSKTDMVQRILKMYYV